ncbi:MAG: hypothetical protein K2X47_04730 [Bdellovibrionales bacterium]|nr:hypothetical protein [Bdellovibrionales bacterium]
MKNLVFGTLIFLIGLGPAQAGEVACPVVAAGEQQASVAQHVQKTLELLGSMFVGTAIQAASAVDYVSHQIDNRIVKAGKSGELINAVTQDPTTSRAAQDQLDVYHAKLETLKQVLEKNVSRFQFRGEQKLLKEIQKNLAATRLESDKAEALTIALQSQIAELRERQEQATRWEKAIDDEVLYVSELLERLRSQAIESQNSGALENFEAEILPRLVGKSNGIIAALAVARATSIHLKSEVETRIGILKGLIDLKTVQPNLVRRAQERLGIEIETAMQASERDSDSISACVAGDLCLGEPVVAWTSGYKTRASTGYDGDLVVGVFGDGKYSVKSRKGEIKTYSRAQIAKATKGLSSQGFSVGQKVVCRDGNLWKIAGIFPDGGFLLQVLHKKLGIFLAKDEFVQSHPWEFTNYK